MQDSEKHLRGVVACVLVICLLAAIQGSSNSSGHQNENRGRQEMLQTAERVYEKSRETHFHIQLKKAEIEGALYQCFVFHRTQDFMRNLHTDTHVFS